jgi:PadR family transcriptional regulator PadR
MPGRGRRGRGRRQRRVIRFMQPCLLVLLHRGEAHGYTLVDGLAEFGFDPDQLDSSILYRALREMEDDHLLRSEWDEDSQGPARRVYRISEAGEAFLTDWINDLRTTRAEIDALIQAYEKVSDD